MANRVASFRRSVAAAMESQCITQGELAKLAGMSQPSISRYLSGSREIRTDTLQRIADALGLTLQEKQ